MASPSMPRSSSTVTLAPLPCRNTERTKTLPLPRQFQPLVARFKDIRYILAAHDTSDLCVCVIFAQGAMLTHHSNHNRHVQQMCSLLGLNKRLQSKKTPGHTDMTQQDTTG